MQLSQYTRTVQKVSNSADTVAIFLPVPENYDEQQRQQQEYLLVNEIQVAYRSMEDTMDFFKRLYDVQIQQAGQIIHTLSADVWSTWLTLRGTSLVKNRKENELFLPLPSGGCHADVRLYPVQIILRFKKFQDEEKRLGAMVWYTFSPTLLLGKPTFYWTVSNTITVRLPGKDDTKTTRMSIELPWFTNSHTRRLGQLVFYVPNANAMIKSGKLWINSDDNNKKRLVYQFDDPYYSVVLDKIHYQMPLPNQTVFTCTFTNWLKDSADSAVMDITSNTTLSLDLEFDPLPADNRPDEVNLIAFAVIASTQQQQQ